MWTIGVLPISHGSMFWLHVEKYCNTLLYKETGFDPWIRQPNIFCCCSGSHASGSNSKMLMLSSHQINSTSWGCEGVFLWCYGCMCMFVMWQGVVACGGGGCCQMMAPGGTMCELKVGGDWGRKKEARRKKKKREEPLRNKQASLPPPGTGAYILQLLVMSTPQELLTAVTWKVFAVNVATGQPLDTTGFIDLLQPWSCYTSHQSLPSPVKYCLPFLIPISM